MARRAGRCSRAVGNAGLPVVLGVAGVAHAGGRGGPRGCLPVVRAAGRGFVPHGGRQMLELAVSRKEANKSEQ
jgi:hypothetical protein